LLRLSVEDVDGLTWREVLRALAEYGNAVMGVWITSGMV
jgi:hypothetical protein